MPSNSSHSGLRDNHTRGTVADFLVEKIATGSQLSIVSAYFTIYAYEALKSSLDGIEHLDFLFGEPRFLNRLDPDKTAKKTFLIDSEGMQLVKKLQQRRVAIDCANWIQEKVAIRTIKQANLLHGKMYHVARGGVEEAILGSSNFTVRGLGLSATGSNIELNLIVDSNRDRQDLKQWFQSLWNDEQLVEDVKEDVLLYLRKLYANQAPQFVYYLTLYHLFRDYLDGTQDLDENLRRIALPDTQIWQALFSFQKDGAKAAINKILNYNGCILADSVGLGKTYTALAVIKYFELRNERVLVLCPKKLRRNWTVYWQSNSLSPFPEDRFRFDVLHHTDLSRDTGNSNGLELSSLNWGAYDLVVIDESHNFRNNKLAVQRPGDTTQRRSRYERLVEDIIASGVRTKVLLLSATPVNNQLADLRNQISFIAGGDVARDDEANRAFIDKLGIGSVRDTTRNAQTHFTNWAKRPPGQRKTRELIAAIGGDFFKMLDGLSIARSRRQIASYYASEMSSLGGFPKRTAPQAIHSDIDLKAKYLSFEELSGEIGKLQLALYYPSNFLRADLPPEIAAQYEAKIHGGFTQKGREKILVAMMRVNFLKRLESSVDSFRLTLERTIGKIELLEQRIEDFQDHLDENPDLDYDEWTKEDLEDPEFEQEDFFIGGLKRFHLSHLKLPEWAKAIGEDRTKLEYLLNKTKIVTPPRDGKLADLRKLIQIKVKNPPLNRDGKELAKVLVESLMAPKKAQHIADWDPFDPQASADFFDPHWMFGRSLTDGFDIVTGNPPYQSAIEHKKVRGEEYRNAIKARYITTSGTWDLYIPFFEAALRFLRDDGILSFITPNKYLSSSYRTSIPESELPNPMWYFFCSFCSVALCEEFLKLLPVLGIVTDANQSKSPESKATPTSSQELLFLGAISGLGFGISEGLIYTADLYRPMQVGISLYFLRFFGIALLHGLWSYLSSAMFLHQAAIGTETKHCLWMSLIGPMCLHALYNTAMMYEYFGLAFLVILMTIAAALCVSILVRTKQIETVPT